MVAGSIPPSRTGVFIVGRRATGLAPAIALRQHGLEVTVADGAEAPIDKTCGQGVMPSGHCRAEGPALMKQITRNGMDSYGGTWRRAGRRTALHRLLIDRAEALGVFFAWRTPVRGLTAQGLPWKRSRAEFVDAMEPVVEDMHCSLALWADALALIGPMARI
jgi:flavin-dependent dehydrogenase